MFLNFDSFGWNDNGIKILKGDVIFVQRDVRYKYSIA